MTPLGINHIAVICSDKARSVAFYRDVLGFQVISEEYRQARQSWMVRMSLAGTYVLELFTFPDSPERPSWPEARGLRHLALTVSDLQAAALELDARGVPHEPIRSGVGESCLFLHDPDGLPIELVQQ